MFIEGNEISRLNKRKVPNDELIMLTVPENITLLQRTQLLLQKTNKTQRMAALSQQNLLCLVKDNPLKFAEEILPMISLDINVQKDEDLIERTASSLEAIVDLKLIKAKYMIELADTLIHHLRVFNKKNKDAMWTDLIIKILQLYTTDVSYIEVAIDLADPLNNKSSQRLAASILIALAPRITPDIQPQIFQIFIRLCRGPHYELRIAAVHSFTQLANMKNINKLQLLSEMAELLDDEQNEVQIVGLQELYTFLQHYTPEQISQSKLIEAIKRLYTKSTNSADFHAYLVEQSVKIMHVSQCTQSLIQIVLNLYSIYVAKQEKCTPLSLKEELGVSGEVADLNEIDEAGKHKQDKKTFLEKLMLGEIDFDKESDLMKQEEQDDLNTEVRILITNNFPALIVLLQSSSSNFEGKQVLETQVLQLFNDLVEDKDYLIRAACAQALPTMCSLVGQQHAGMYFGQSFMKLLKDPNPFVIQHLMNQIEMIFEAFQEEELIQVSAQWVLIADLCQSRGCWRLHKLYYEKTRFIVRFLHQEQVQQLIPNFEISFKNAPKLVLPELFITLIEILKLPNFGLRDEIILLISQSLAQSESSQQRLLCLKLFEVAMGPANFSRQYFRLIFSELIFQFRRETHPIVLKKFCAMAPELHKHADYYLDIAKGKFMLAPGHTPFQEILEFVKQTVIKEQKRLQSTNIAENKRKNQLLQLYQLLNETIKYLDSMQTEFDKPAAESEIKQELQLIDQDRQRFQQSQLDRNSFKRISTSTLLKQKSEISSNTKTPIKFQRAKSVLGQKTNQLNTTQQTVAQPQLTQQNKKPPANNSAITKIVKQRKSLIIAKNGIEAMNTSTQKQQLTSPYDNQDLNSRNLSTRSTAQLNSINTFGNAATTIIQSPQSMSSRLANNLNAALQAQQKQQDPDVIIQRSKTLRKETLKSAGVQRKSEGGTSASKQQPVQRSTVANAGLQIISQNASSINKK